ncbi:glycosyltransferase [Parasulfitobacter algicola]|uniref:Glycosyltransferase family 2 protein n=1 Tax=Parasulfitobacter algicola TaxID=2614809 RepID=A0ABX2J0I0_9RHOB|nr:glycosyltransferase family 2 protein [Sulfitobacter algicola]
MTAVSIVIPMKNEAGNVETVLAEIAEHCTDVAYEVIIIDDASTDGTADAVRALKAVHPTVRLLQNTHSGGQSAAVHSGVNAALADIICTLDGDGQNPPCEIPKLYQPLLADQNGKLGLVAGQRIDRQDTTSKRAASKLANSLRKRILHDGTRDTGCGLKGFRKDAFLELPYFDHMHRYLPALFKCNGWDIALVDVSHRERGAGRSNYSNIQRAFVGVFDLMGVAWLIRRRKKAHPTEVPLDG